MKAELLGFIVIVGSACVSPAETAGASTSLYRVPCATPVYAITANPFKRLQTPNTISREILRKKPSKRKRR
jgi:hypothetical protein